MTAGIALGSNIEPRLQYLQRASQHLRNLAIPESPFLTSHVYETSPIDCPQGSPPFLNAALELSTSLSPLTLLAELLRIESLLGRPTLHARNSPRPLDLDLLYCDTVTLNSPELILPHPRLTSRRFVLQPLSDIRPDLTFDTKTVEQWLESSNPSEEVKIISDYNLISG
jgi:2-amino-4-hydroxy-6-hydroxymethyldihydropteridine diphosphokinase